MTSEFKVMTWLRKVREEHAREQVGLTDRERIEQDRTAADEVRNRLFKRRRRESEVPAIPAGEGRN